MFEVLFNQPASVWQEATWVFESGWPLWGLLVSAAIILAALLLASLRQSISVGKRITVLFLQSVVLLTGLTMLWRPALEISVTEQGENSIAWLLDGSSSMNMADVNGSTRQVAMREALAQNQLLDTSIFEHELYRFGETLESVDTLEAISTDTPSERTDIANSLDSLLNDLNDTALAAIVLVSDGADNVGDLDSRWWQAISAAGIPIHTIGIGSEVMENDLEIRSVVMPPQSHEDALINATVVLRHSGVTNARLRVSAGRDLLAATDLNLPADQLESVHTIEFNAGSAGVRQLEFSIDSLTNEANTDNNRLPRMLDVQDRPRRILYVEGEPRWEYKFLRRAVHDSEAVQLVSLLRTSPNKFYRQGVADAEELSEGFPDSAEKLFAYDAVIIGSLEAAELSTVQQAALSSSLDAETYQRARAIVRPTLAGLRTPWLQFDEDASLNREAWDTLPEIADSQLVGTPKPGAVVLLEVEDSNGSNARPLLVWQRYGRGHSAVMGSSGTWRWQMRLDSTEFRIRHQE